MNDLTIKAVLFEPPIDDYEGPGCCGSIGLVYDNDRVVWGDITLGPRAPTSVAWDGQGLETIAGALVGTTLGIPEVFEVLNGEAIASVGGDAEWQAGVRRGLEMALIMALAQLSQTSPAAVVSQTLGSESSAMSQLLQLFVEVENQAATAEVVERMIRLQPDGVGYRLAEGNAAETIGAQAEYLQRFVRELSLVLAARNNPPPIGYLGLNGAIGRLTADPLRGMGQVLGHCAGLEQAAGGLSLWLEDPLVLNDEMAHAAALYQLRDFMRVRNMGSRIIARAHANNHTGLQLLCETGAIDGVCLVWEEWGGLKSLADAARLAQQAGKLVTLTAARSISHDQLMYLLDIGQALAIDAVLMGMGRGDGIRAGEAHAALSRRRIIRRYHSEQS